MNRIPIKDYNLPMTLLGGQSFGWDYVDGWFYGFTQTRAVKLREKNGYLEWQTYPDLNDEEFIIRYLRLDVDHEKIIKTILKDKYVKTAYETNPNIRLLQQGYPETVISYICSANNSIVNIRKSVRMMAERYGNKVDVEGRIVSLFPSIESIVSASEVELREYKVGFRAKYIKSGAEFLLRSGHHEDLETVHGIGNKIADCVRVYSLVHDHITPLDVWGKRFLVQYYGLDPKMKYEEMSKWVSEYFDGYAGWAGQYLFEYIRNARDTINKQVK